MSKTLFWYLLKDLLRIFLLASGTLAGIMSFGALLRPLTQHGLDASQVGKILSYFSPAMTTYSFPVAALFATTFVYGRLSADNELTACRASGISHWAMTWPAILLGLIVALVSLLFLSFIVPLFTLKVEQVIYSNMAQLVANKITRTHEVSYGKTTIFAQAAYVVEPIEWIVISSPDPATAARIEAIVGQSGVAYQARTEGLRAAYPQADWRPILENILKAVSPKPAPESPDPAAPNPAPTGVRIALIPGKSDDAEYARALDRAYPLADAVKALPARDAQVVSLISPMVFSYATVDAPDAASFAANDKNRKMKVPSKIWMAKEATAYIARQGDSVQLELVLSEGGNFPRGAGGSQVVVREAQFGPIALGSPIRENTKFMDIKQLKDLLSAPETSRRLNGLVQQFIKDEQRQTYFDQITRSLQNPRLRSYRFIAETETLIVSGIDLDVRSRLGELVITPLDETGGQRVRVDRESDGNIVSSDTARQVRITVDPLDHPPDAEGARMIVSVRGYDVLVKADEDPAAHETFPRTINVPIPQDLRAVEKNNVEHYLKTRAADRDEHGSLKYHYDKLLASIRAEMHARASFAVSCFILVMVGCALGMISKSGNFLSAFAVSVIPALLCIALIVTGQHTCENTPKSMKLGLWLIWSGNIVVFAFGAILLVKLQRE